MGLKLWEEFRPKVSDYAAKRNFVDSVSSGVSRLSPWLNKGLLSEEEIQDSVLEEHSFSSVEKFLQEVYWRRYWRGYLSHRPQIWRAYRDSVAALSAQPRHQDFLTNTTHGNCSVAIMGYFAKQLVETGYLHNHARMWFAAWWIHIEQQPWELGAHFFLQHLIDGDPAVNTLSWRWVAGLHTSGKDYLPRRNNLERYLSAELLAQYSDGLELLESPTSRPQVDNVTDLSPNIATDRTALELSLHQSGLTTLVGFADDLDVAATVRDLRAEGTNITQVHILYDSQLESEFSPQKNTWNKEALEAVIQRLRSGGLHASAHELGTADLANLFPTMKPNEPFLLQRPEIGYYSDRYRLLLDIFPQALPYYSERKHALNSFAKSGFFGYWKKAKKLLQPDA